MNLKPKRALPIFLASVLLLMSCDMSTFALSQQIPTPIPGAIKLMVIQTAAVAATETAALIPPTLTPTLTPFPSLNSGEHSHDYADLYFSITDINTHTRAHRR